MRAFSVCNGGFGRFQTVRAWKDNSSPVPTTKSWRGYNVCGPIWNIGSKDRRFAYLPCESVKGLPQPTVHRDELNPLEIVAKSWVATVLCCFPMQHMRLSLQLHFVFALEIPDAADSSSLAAGHRMAFPPVPAVAMRLPSREKVTPLTGPRS